MKTDRYPAWQSQTSDPAVAVGTTRLSRGPREGQEKTERSKIVRSTAVTSENRDREGREEPAARRPPEDEAGERSRLSDSIVGLFDRLRAAAESHDGE